MDKRTQDGNRRPTPFEQIADRANIPEALKRQLPRKWEMLGHCLLLKIPEELQKHETEVARAYADILNARAVLEDGGISGTLRKPSTRLLLGTQKDCETIHKENGVRYLLDPSRVMFSSGNVDERIRMATVSNPEETVVDMFAGIGYFTLPIAVHSRPKAIYACEMNPDAFDYLEKNIELNRVTDCVTPLLGNNRETAPRGVADRVIMGYLPTTHEFLPLAMTLLRSTGGIIHYHETCPEALLPGRPRVRVEAAARDFGRGAEVLLERRIKSYAPGVFHVVLDVSVS